MRSVFAATVLACVLALPSTSPAIAIVLTEAGAGSPELNGITQTAATSLVSVDFYLDIEATTLTAPPGAAYVDDVSSALIFIYLFRVDAGPGVVFQPPAGVGYTPAPFWLSQIVTGDPGFVSWNDSLFNNTVGIPPNFGLGGFAPGLQLLGTLTFVVVPFGPVGDPILSIRNGSASFVDLDLLPETVILSRALDSDGDGEFDSMDNCPFVPNGSGEVTGPPTWGEQAESVQYAGVGCACLCGDPTRDCLINVGDAPEAQRAGLFPPLPPLNPVFDIDFCDINGDALCNVGDAPEMARAGLIPPLPPLSPTFSVTGCPGYLGP